MAEKVNKFYPVSEGTEHKPIPDGSIAPEPSLPEDLTPPAPVPPAPPEIIRTIPWKNNPAKEPCFTDNERRDLQLECKREVYESVTSIAGAIECALDFLNKAVEYGVIRDSKHFAHFLEDLESSDAHHDKASYLDFVERKTAVVAAVTARFEELLEDGVEVTKPTKMKSDFLGANIAQTIAGEVSDLRWARIDEQDRKLGLPEPTPSRHFEWQKKHEALLADPEFKKLSANLDKGAKQTLVREMIGEEPDDRLEFLSLPIFNR